jgi:hypothetical protein
VEDFVVVLSSSVRRYLVTLDRPEQDLLKTAIVQQLRAEHERKIPVADGAALMQEVAGFLITYRPLTAGEERTYKAKRGYFISSIWPLWPGYPR